MRSDISDSEVGGTATRSRWSLVYVIASRMWTDFKKDKSCVVLDSYSVVNQEPIGTEFDSVSIGK